MSVHRLETTHALPIGLDAAWAFFSNPRNLSEITPPWLGFEVTSGVPDEMYAGLILTYNVRPILGIPLTWVTEITHVDARRLFVDEQRMGPYAFWHHQHHFRETATGTEMRDIVHFAIPGGPLGDVMVKLLVRPKVKAIFAYRRAELRRRYPSAPPATA